MAFCPDGPVLQLAAASSDGRVSVLQHQASNNTWVVHYLQDCPLGVNAVSWGPDQRLVTAGCDNTIRFWKFHEGEWKPDEAVLETSSGVSHADWVRDVAWAPVLVPNHNMVASCSEDCTVLVWKQSEENGPWKPTLLHTFESPVWRVSWSVTGHLLAVSSGDSDVSLWKAGLDGNWSQVSSVEAEAQPEATS